MAPLAIVFGLLLALLVLPILYAQLPALRLAIVFGLLLALLGPALYSLSTADERSLTALIPSGFGIVLIILGVVARNEKLRMHAMHGAALVGLLGFAIPAYMVGNVLIRGSEIRADPARRPSHDGGAVPHFLGLCVKSFIDARIARKKKEAETQV